VLTWLLTNECPHQPPPAASRHRRLVIPGHGHRRQIALLRYGECPSFHLAVVDGYCVRLRLASLSVSPEPGHRVKTALIGPDRKGGFLSLLEPKANLPDLSALHGTVACQQEWPGPRDDNAAVYVLTRPEPRRCRVSHTADCSSWIRERQECSPCSLAARQETCRARRPMRRFFVADRHWPVVCRPHCLISSSRFVCQQSPSVFSGMD